VSIRFINKEILNEKLKNDTQSLFENYPLFNTYNFIPTIKVYEPEKEDIHKVSENNLKEASGEKSDNKKIYI
jgi:hypothetical protein